MSLGGGCSHSAEILDGTTGCRLCTSCVCACVCAEGCPDP